MIDYASIKPVMSLSTFIVGIIIVLLIGRAIVELTELIEKRKSAGMGASQKAIQRYYNTYRKGA